MREDGMIKQLRSYFLFASLVLASLSIAKTDDIFKGVKGPTNFQVDERVTYSRNEKNIESLTNNLILKYWDGDSTNIGKWAFINFPYRLATFPISNKGLGDIIFGLGPRGKIQDLYYFLYVSLTIPTGNQGLSNNRYDVKTGTFITYLTKDKKFEIDCALEYNITGKNDKDINPTNEFYSGILAGGAINNKVRFVTGLINLAKDNGDFVLNSRSIFRYTFSPNFHFELINDFGINAKNIPMANSVGFFVRYNF